MNVRSAFEAQAIACEKLGSPFMGQLCRLFARRLSPGHPVADRVLGWPGDVTSNGQSVPLRMAGALHALVLTKVDDALVSVYPPSVVEDDRLWDVVEAAMIAHKAQLMQWLESPPQTNEVRRAAAMMMTAALLRARTGLPLAVSELGASAGLNLLFDRFGMVVDGRIYGAPESAVLLRPEWQGPQPPALPIEIIDRAGVDLRPIDARDPVQALRLLAYLWPDQPHRLALTRAAIALLDDPPQSGDAAQWLEGRLARAIPGAVHMVFHTIAWQYFPAETKRRCAAAIDAAAMRATPDAPLAHMSMEADDTPGSAALTLRFWNGRDATGRLQTLGRIDFHGRFLDILPASQWQL
ncbi:MAG: DUF2332 family protein [Pseudomonadota bacterium]